MHRFSNQDHQFLEPTVSFFTLSFSFSIFSLTLELRMGYSHLLSMEAFLANFRAVYDIPGDVDIAYCHEGDIALQRRSGSNVVFFPLMTILEGGVRFPVDPFVLSTLRFYGLCPEQLPLNFYRVVSCVSRFNRIYGLRLNCHDINFMYSLCGNIRFDYYLKVRDVRV